MNLQEMYKNVVINELDGVLIDYDLYFDEKIGSYSRFAVDDEYERAIVKEICQKLMELGTKIYVYAYNEDEDERGEKSIYADCLWIDTTLSINELYELYKEVEPSDISFVEETEEYQQTDLFLFKTTGEIAEYKKNWEDFGRMKSLYWD